MNTGKAARQQHLLHGRRTRRQRLKKFVRTPRFLSAIGLVLCFGLGAPPKFVSGRVFMSMQTPNPAQLDNAAARQRVKNFLTAWLIHRDRLETLTYIAEEAYRRPPIVGSACDGWYRPSDSPPRVREIVGRNLINSANTHPKDTPLENVLIIQALPARLKPFATNPFEEDLFFLGRLDDTSLMKVFEPGRNPYRDMIKDMLKQSSPVYWALLLTMQGDGDFFGVYTLWQRVGGQWSVTAIDISCQ